MEHGAVALIHIEDIHILNPRVRNQIIAEEIRQNIRSVGLKRPITVAPRKDSKNGKKYDLVCGQGRIEAYIAAGVTEIPAIVREVNEEDAHLMSLVENIARRNSSALELLQSIKYLKGQGYADDAIAAKTNLGKDYIRGIIRLLEEGEEYLVNAVEKGRIPLRAAWCLGMTGVSVPLKSAVQSRSARPVATAYRKTCPQIDLTRWAVSIFSRASILRNTCSMSVALSSEIARVPT